MAKVTKTFKFGQHEVVLETGEIALANQNVQTNVVMIGSANEVHVSAFRDHPEFPSFRGRFEMVAVPYLRNYVQEQKIYDQQIALSANASFRAGLEPGLFELYVEMKPGKSAAEGEKSLYAELDRLATEGPTERELQKARNQAESGFIGALKTNNGAGQALGFFEHVHGDYKKFFGAIDRYRAVTAADCRRVAKQVFDPTRRTVATLVPLEVGKEAQP